jgi:signal transduction histidine kinase
MGIFRAPSRFLDRIARRDCRYFQFHRCRQPTDGAGIEARWASLDVQPPDFPRLSIEVETAVFRIVQEALTSVFRHSEAHKVSITLSQSNGMITVSVKDDDGGIGENIAEMPPDSVGFRCFSNVCGIAHTDGTKRA